MNRTLRTALVAVTLLVLAPGLGGCARGYTGGDYVPAGGVDASNGRMVLDDVWIDGPHGVAAGAGTGLRLYVADDSRHPDALTGVTVPVARHAQLMLHGHPVRRIPVGRWKARDLEWRSDRNGVRLSGMRRSVEPGQWFWAVFRFQHSRPVRMRVTVAPLAPERGPDRL